MFRTPSFRVDNTFEDEWPNILVCSMDGVFVGFSVELHESPFSEGDVT